MDTTTGTFTTMDTYQGSLFDPVSLHKYLYANANPVINVDPSGFETDSIQEITGVMACMGIIAISCQMQSNFAMNYYKQFKKDFVNVTNSIANFIIKTDELILGISSGFIFAATDVIRNELIATTSIVIESTFTLVKEHVEERLRIKGNRYRDQYELHHIVAQYSFIAIPARAILHLTDIDVNRVRVIWYGLEKPYTNFCIRDFIIHI